jgi:hypothetical protein
MRTRSMHVISCAITAFLVCSVSEHSSWAQVTTAKPLASNNKKPDKKNAEKKKPLPTRCRIASRAWPKQNTKRGNCFTKMAILPMRW